MKPKFVILYKSLQTNGNNPAELAIEYSGRVRKAQKIVEEFNSAGYVAQMRDFAQKIDLSLVGETTSLVVLIDTDGCREKEVLALGVPVVFVVPLVPDSLPEMAAFAPVGDTESVVTVAEALIHRFAENAKKRGLVVAEAAS